MLDLTGLTESFMRNRLKLKPWEETAAFDKETLRTFSDRNRDLADREKAILGWLKDYKATLFFPPECSKEISRRIV